MTSGREETSHGTGKYEARDETCLNRDGSNEKGGRWRLKDLGIIYSHGDLYGGRKNKNTQFPGFVRKWTQDKRYGKGTYSEIQICFLLLLLLCNISSLFLLLLLNFFFQGVGVWDVVGSVS